MTGLKIALQLLAILTALACTVLLARQYLRQGVRLLLWSSLCFVGLTLNNVLVVVDLLVFPEIDLRALRLAMVLAGLSCMLYGFIVDSET